MGLFKFIAKPLFNVVIKVSVGAIAVPLRIAIDVIDVGFDIATGNIVGVGVGTVIIISDIVTGGTSKGITSGVIPSF